MESEERSVLVWTSALVLALVPLTLAEGGGGTWVSSFWGSFVSFFYYLAAWKCNLEQQSLGAAGNSHTSPWSLRQIFIQLSGGQW